MKRLNFVVPIKYFTHAKQRLMSVLSGSERAGLASQLYRKNLRWLLQNYPQHNVLVVTPDTRAADMARALGADCLLEQSCEGLNNAIARGTEWSGQHGFETQVLFFPDIARPKKSDMDILLQYSGKNSLLALAVATDNGTNALLATPPSATPLLFGSNSSHRIVAAAKERGLNCYPLSLESLALDVDRPEDLQLCAVAPASVLMEACV